jgi:hypothetical protein
LPPPIVEGAASPEGKANHASRAGPLTEFNLQDAGRFGVAGRVTRNQLLDVIKMKYHLDGSGEANDKYQPPPPRAAVLPIEDSLQNAGHSRVLERFCHRNNNQYRLS